MFRKILFVTLTIALLVIPVGVPAGAQGAVGTAISNLNVRSGPGQQFPAITTVPAGTRLAVEARNSVGNWVFVHTADGNVRGWVASRYLIWEGTDLVSLPVGTRLMVGDEVVLQMSQIGKECHTACAIRRQVGDCIMPREGIFARVINGGSVKAGDPIKTDNEPAFPEPAKS